MSTQRIPAPLATALLAAEGGDFQALRAATPKPTDGSAAGGSRFEGARPRLVGEIRSTRAGIWGGNDGKALFQNFKNGNDSPAPAGKLDNGESGQEEVDGFEGRFRFSVPQPQPRPKLDI